MLTPTQKAELEYLRAKAATAGLTEEEINRRRKLELEEEREARETIGSLIPQSMSEGPPLPKRFGIKWPWK